MSLSDNLRVMAGILDLSPDALLAYADEYQGAPDRVILYALIRATRPARVLEAGTHRGESANVILDALHANGSGFLTTVDIIPGCGDMISTAYHNYQIVCSDIVDYVNNYTGEGFDFIHEDSSHEVHTVRVVYEYLHKLAPDGCVIISHDVATGVGEAIRTGIKDAGIKPLPEFVPDGSLGYTVYKYQ
jgi:predicted O-methyltransferase YrrM